MTNEDSAIITTTLFPYFIFVAVHIQRASAYTHIYKYVHTRTYNKNHEYVMNKLLEMIDRLLLEIFFLNQ